MAWALVRQAVSSGSPTTITAPTSGNRLVVMVGSTSSTGANRTVSSIACTNVTGFVQLSANSNGSQAVEIWVGSAGASAGTSVAVTMSGATNVLDINVAEYSGGTATSDAITGGSTGTGTALTTGAFTVNTAADLLIVVEYGSGTISVNPSGYTAALTAIGNLHGSYLLSASAGSNAAATWTGSTATWATTVAGLKLSAGASANWLKETYWWNRNRNSGRS